MKPINPKDKPKVIGLSVLSFILLSNFGLTAFRAMSKPQPQNGVAQIQANPNPPPPPPPVVTPLAANPGGVVATATPKPLSTLGLPTGETGPSNPFRHVLPDMAELQRQEAERNRSKQTQIVRPPTLHGNLPGPGVAFAQNVTAVVPVDPTIRLDGVVTDRDHYAMVTFEDRTDMYRVGSRIAGLFTVIGITDSGASFRGPKGVFRLDVGDQRTATAPVEKDVPAKAIRKASGRQTARPQEMADFSTLPLPAIDGPAVGRGQ